MKVLNDKVDVDKNENKYVVKRVIEEEYEKKEIEELVKNMEVNLDRLSQQIEQLMNQKLQLEKNLKFWKEKI